MLKYPPIFPNTSVKSSYRYFHFGQNILRLSRNAIKANFHPQENPQLGMLMGCAQVPATPISGTPLQPKHSSCPWTRPVPGWVGVTKDLSIKKLDLVSAIPTFLFSTRRRTQRPNPEYSFFFWIGNFFSFFFFLFVPTGS